MHNNLYEFVCAELEDLDRKAQAGKIEMRDIEYADMLEHYKKSKLTNHAMEGEGFSGRGSYGGYGYGMRSYADQPRDSMGRFRASYADHSLADELRRRAGMERDEVSRREMERMADRFDRGA